MAEEWDAAALADEIARQIQELPLANVPHMRAIRRRHSQRLKGAPPELFIPLARELKRRGEAWIGFELINRDERAMARVGAAELAEFGQGMAGWGDVDAFAGLLAGAAWLRRQIPDALIHEWARSPDRWWRRAALAATVVLNTPNQGGHGDPERTLAVCRLLADDSDDMVVKALSWALRKLAVFNAPVVRAFLADHDAVLAARVKREVRHKLATGRKNPRRKSGDIHDLA
ncbi:MAG: DNA alkylation repair protein [Acidobacteria bacterium]|nr:DNA alkylation repair protein [Acidobacteriota bacterium]